MSFGDDPTQGAAGAGEDPLGGAVRPDTSGDPTQGTERGSTATDDPSQGVEVGEDPREDPTEGSEFGESPGEDPSES
jgi:hypothetical protein